MDSDFETSYNSTMRELSDRGIRDSHLESWKFVEEVRLNTGADGYFPEWLSPYTAFVSQVTGLGEVTNQDDSLPKLRAVIMRAAQLGYTEGYFAGKDD